MVKLFVDFCADHSAFLINFEESRNGRVDFDTVVINNIPSAESGLNLISYPGFEMEILAYVKVHAIILRVYEKIHENFDKIPLIFEFSKKKSILVAFVSTVYGHESKTYWMLPSGRKYRSVFIGDDVGEAATSYLHDFLLDEIKQSKTGIMEPYLHKDNLDLYEIGDKHGNNLLYQATKSNNFKAVESFLAIGLDPENKAPAIDAAWKNLQDLSDNDEDEQRKNDNKNILMSLLNANSRFPSAANWFDCENAPKEVKEFLNKCENLHTLVDQEDFTKFEEDINNVNDQNLVYYYNRHNQSVFVYGLKTKKYKIINYIKDGLSIGNHEDLNDAYDKVDFEKKVSIRKEYENVALDYPDVHILNLYKKSKFFPNDLKRQKTFVKKVNEAFVTMNSENYCSKLLKIAALWTKLNIFFDFNHEHAKYMSPQSSTNTQAVIYGTGQIFIGAKGLLDDEKKFKTFGVVIHELCHAAMLLIYCNNFEPYMNGENSDKADYEKVVAECCRLKKSNYFVENAFLYAKKFQHSELIVTYPQNLMSWLQDEDKIEFFKQKFAHLLDYSKKTIEPELNRGLLAIELIQDETKNVNFDDLTLPMQTKVLNSVVVYQGQEAKIKILCKDDPEILNALTSRNIRDLLLTKNKIEIIGQNGDFINTGAILERTFVNFVTQDYQGHPDSRQCDRNPTPNPNDVKIIPSHATSTQSQQTFTHDQLKHNSANVIDQSGHQQHESIASDIKIELYTSNSSTKPITSQKNFNQLKEELTKSRAVVITSFLGSGASSFLCTTERKLRKEDKNICMSYINLKDYEKIFDKFINKALDISQVLNIFEAILEEIQKSNSSKLSTDTRAIYLLDGLDQIWTKYGEFWLKIFRIIKQDSKIELIISATPRQTQQLEEIFNIQAVRFAPLTEVEIRNFIKNNLKSLKKFEDATIAEMTEKILEFLKYLATPTISGHDYEPEMNNLSLIIEITSLYIEKGIIPDPSNLYEIFSKIDKIMYRNFLCKNDDDINSNISIHSVHEVLALKTIFDESSEHKNGFKLNKLAIIKAWDMKNRWTYDAVRDYGIVGCCQEFENKLEDEQLKIGLRHEIEDHNLKIEENNLKAEENDLEIEDHNLKVKDHSLRIKDQNLKFEDYNFKVEDHNLKVEDHNLKIEDYNLKFEDHNLNVEEPNLKIQATNLKAEENSLKIEDHNLKIEEPNLKAEENNLKVERHKLKINNNQVNPDLNPEEQHSKVEESSTFTSKFSKFNPKYFERKIKAAKSNLEASASNILTFATNVSQSISNLTIGKVTGESEAQNVNNQRHNLKNGEFIDSSEKDPESTSSVAVHNLEKWHNLKIDGTPIKFIHKSFIDYFVARFVVDFVTSNNSGINDKEILNVFKLLEILAKDGKTFTKIRDFIISSKDLHYFDEKIKKLANGRIAKIHNKMRKDVIDDPTLDSFEFFAKLFKNDEKLERNLWNVNEQLSWKEKTLHVVQESQQFVNYAKDNIFEPLNLPKFFQELNIFEKTLYPKGELNVDYAINLAEYCFGSDWDEKLNQSGEKLTRSAEMEDNVPRDWKNDENIQKLCSFVDKNFSVEKREKFGNDVKAIRRSISKN